MSQNSYRTETATTGAAIDAGLQGYMRGVFNTMSVGLVITGMMAFAVANIEPVYNLVFHTPLKWVAMFGPIAFLWMGFTSSRIARMDSSQLRKTFLAFTAMMGLSMAAIFQHFTGVDIARAFFVTSAAFAGTSLYGYVTKKDLTGMGSFLFMGLMGIFVASIVNIFLGSAMIHFIVSVLGVFIFTGLTAFETQRLKETYRQGHTEANNKLAIIGALNLYLYFINLFQIILSFMGGGRD